ncbi:MAG: TonB-dependent receptor plug domain-containing protein [Rhodothermales bacterium]
MGGVEMKLRRNLFTVVLLCLTAVLSWGCVQSQATADRDGANEQEIAEETERQQTDRRVGGVSAAAARDVDWSSVIGEEEAEGRSITHIEELLRGQVAGVDVVEGPGGMLSVRIRGTSSFMGSNEPLYVVDGMPMTQADRGGLGGVNVHDIARIEVLKDVDAKALYGSRGGNGVILISTKRGR